MALDAEQQREAVRRIAAWRASPLDPVACPTCGVAGLRIVDRSVRGEGVGAHLLKAFESEAAKRGATYATLRTGAGERQHEFYRRHGYVDWYRMPQWRGGRDFVQMRRAL